MIYSKLLAFAVFCGAAYSQSEVTVYSEAGCKGDSQVIKSDENCSSLSDKLQYKVSGVKVPEGHVCNFYTDTKCEKPLFGGLEGAVDACDLSAEEYDFDDKTGSVLCFLADAEESEL